MVFLNQYQINDGGKVINLVLRLVWREQVDGPLFTQSIHNICTDPDTNKSDAHYVAHVFDYHLKSRSTLNPGTFSKIYLVGTHGGHFSSAETNELWGKEKFLRLIGKKLMKGHFFGNEHFAVLRP